MQRYIERNPLRANLVERVQDWRWSSAGPRTGDDPVLDLGPVRRSEKWLDFVNTPQTEAEVKRIRECVRRGRPFGASAWTKKTAVELGLEASLRALGRPRKLAAPQQSLFDERRENVRCPLFLPLAVL